MGSESGDEMEMLQESILDIFIRYGLFIGAIFQLVCIGAVILMPDSKSDYFQVIFRFSCSEVDPISEECLDSFLG